MSESILKERIKITDEKKLTKRRRKRRKKEQE
jgi:hypothetical protein